MAANNTTNNNAFNNNTPDYNVDRDDTVTTTHTADETEPATKHDVGIGGGLGAVGGAVVGALAGGPIGAVIGAVVGGVASAGAVDVVDKRDGDYDRTAHGDDTAALGTTPAATTGYPAGTVTGYPAATTGYAAETPGYAADTTDYAAPTAGTTALGTDADMTDDARRIQLREEQLRAETRTVQAGEVHVHKDVITETRSIDVPVTREELVIERHPVAGVTAANANFSQDDQTIRIPLTEEQVTLQKNAVVTEEVEIGKRRVTETQHLTDSVRHEELRVHGTGDVDEMDEDELDSDVNPARPNPLAR